MKHYEFMIKNFIRYKESNSLCDVTLVVEGVKIPLHRIVLAASSKYFEIMFTTNMAEKYQREIKIQDIPVTSFLICVDFIYTGKFELKIEEVMELLHTACLLQLWEIKEKCVTEIVNTINPDNCIQFYHLSQIPVYDCPQVQSKAIDVLMKNAESLLLNDKILAEMNVKVLGIMLKSSNMRISSESLVFESLVKWLNADKENRMDDFCKLFSHVRLPVISEDYLTNVVGRNDHLKECHKCNTHLKRVQLHKCSGPKHGFHDVQLQVRTDIEPLYVPWGCRELKVLDIFHETLLPDDKLDPMPMSVQCKHFVHHNDKIYILGSCSEQRAFYCDYRKQKSWHELPPMPYCHNHDFVAPSIIGFQDKILVIGGLLKRDGTKLVSCLDTNLQKWKKFPSLNTGRMKFATAITNKGVYAIGGENTLSVTLFKVEFYEEASNQWKAAPSLRCGRSKHSAAYYRNTIFVVGGIGRHWELLKSVETLKDGSKAWTMVNPKLNFCREDSSSFVYCNKLYVFGGVRRMNSSVYEIWNDETKEWKASDMKDDGIESCTVLLRHKEYKL